MASTRTTLLACGLALLSLLGGCYPVASVVPAVTETTRAAKLPLQSGRYCTPYDDGAVEIGPDQCFLLEVGAGTVVATGEDPEEPGTATFDIAELSGGTWLLQYWDEEQAAYTFYIALANDDSVVGWLEVGYQTSAMEDLAADVGVTLDTTRATMIDPETGETQEVAQGVKILAGEPTAILDFMRGLTAIMFEEARAEDPPGGTLKTEATYFMRVEGDVAPDRETVIAKMAELQAMIDRAMAEN